MTFAIGNLPSALLSAVAEQIEHPGEKPEPVAQAASDVMQATGRTDWSWAGVAAHRGVDAAPSTPNRVSAEEQVKSEFKQEFGAKAADKKGFDAFMRQVYGDKYDVNLAEQYRQRALAGDYSWLPDVKFVDACTLHGANGAYNAQEGVVYINKDVAASDPHKAAQTFVEEAGHHLDARLNTTDTQGDEGEMFRRVLAGEQLSTQQIEEIRSDDDHGTIVVDGKQVDVEFWNPFKAAANFVSDVVDKGKEVVSDVVDKGKEVVGDVAQYVGNAGRDVVYSVGDAFKAGGTGIVDGAKMFVNGLFHDAIGGWLTNMLNGRVADAFESVGNGLEKMVIQAPRRVMNGFIEGAGHALKTLTYWLPEKAGGALVRNVIDRGVDSVRSVANAAVDVVRNTARLPFEIVGGFSQDMGGALKHWARGDVGEGFKRFGLAFVHPVERVAGSFVDDTMIVAQGFGNVVGNVSGQHEPSRGLNNKERDYLQSVYGNSLDLEDVRIHRDNISHKLGAAAPHTVGNDIYLPDWCFDSNGDLNERGKIILVHEAFHVYQSQHGGNGYIHGAFEAQLGGIIEHGDWKSGYDFTEAVRDGKPFQEWNAEQQAEFFETIARARTTLPGVDTNHDGKDDLRYDANGDGRVDANEFDMARRDDNLNGMGDPDERPAATTPLTEDQLQQLMGIWEAAKDNRADRTIVA